MFEITEVPDFGWLGIIAGGVAVVALLAALLYTRHVLKKNDEDALLTPLSKSVIAISASLIVPFAAWFVTVQLAADEADRVTVSEYVEYLAEQGIQVDSDLAQDVLYWKREVEAIRDGAIVELKTVRINDEVATFYRSLDSDGFVAVEDSR
jgi:hypothetical protein